MNPVCDLQRSSQFDPGEATTLCGPWTVAELKYAGRAGQGPTGNAQQIDDLAEQLFTQYIGPNVTSDEQGSSIDNMHQFFHDCALHYWDMPISPSSLHADDVARVKKALDFGFPVAVTVNELSVRRRDGSIPYAWQPALGPLNHIFSIVGYTNDGYFLVGDEANVNDAWPDEYSEAFIEMHWASVVELPWLPAIQNGDPLTWKAPQQPAPLLSDADLAALWSLIVPDIRTNTGIHNNAWLPEVKAGKWRGVPTHDEIKITWKGVPDTPLLQLTGGFYTWEGGIAYWHPNS